MMMYVPLILLAKQCWCSEFRLQKEQKDLYMYRQTLLGIPTNFNSSHPWNALEDIELFKKIGAYRRDRKTLKEGVTLAGLLMFGKGDSLNEQEVVPNFFPDYRAHLSETIRWTDRLYPDGTW